MKKIITVLLSLVIALAVLFSGLVYVSSYHPSAIENEAIVSLTDAPMVSKGQKIKLLSWNVQFLASNENNHFFFDKGTDPWPQQNILDKTALDIARIIKQENPDVILLQELDDGADRTFNEDQLQKLLMLLPKDYAVHTSSFYWKAGFVPHPQIMGSVGMKLSIISKYKLAKAVRYSLPAITSDNILVEQFNVKRAIHGAYLPVKEGGKLHILNTHLSAFAQGDNTMELQVALVNDLLKGIKDKGEMAVLAGDFNLIPSTTAYQALTARNQEYYNSSGSEISPLLTTYKSVPSLQETLADNPKKWFTHMGNHNQSKVPDKTIDYIFYVGPLNLGEHYVLADGATSISDHLPLVANFTLP